MEPPSFLASSEVSTVKKKKTPTTVTFFRLDTDIYQTFYPANQLPGSEGVLRVVACGSCTIFVASNALINALRFVF